LVVQQHLAGAGTTCCRGKKAADVLVGALQGDAELVLCRTWRIRVCADSGVQLDEVVER